MATETFTRLIDDLDDTKAERTVDFAWDGVWYSIDLSKMNRPGESGDFLV
jgi:hypothetical protein